MPHAKLAQKGTLGGRGRDTLEKKDTNNAINCDGVHHR